MRTGCWRLPIKRSSFTSPPVEGVAQVAKPVPGESKIAPVVYHGPVEPEVAPAVGQGPAESVIEDDVDGSEDGGAA